MSRRASGKTQTGLLLLGVFVACGTQPAVSKHDDAGLGGAPAEAGSAGEAGAVFELPTSATLPPSDFEGDFWLSRTGLYANITTKELAGDLLELEPRFPLWSDGAQKRRFLRLPAGETIDNSDPDHWTLPVGTWAFKEFSVDGKRIETRLIVRTGAGRFDYWMGAFVWNEDESDARFTPKGEPNARATQHDVPSTKQCGTCHNGEPGRYLGVSALQLGGPRGALATLMQRELLSDPREAELSYSPPGDATSSAALGYLHANCGHCHNPAGASWPDTDMVLRLSLSDQTLEDTDTYLTTVGVEARSFMDADHALRIAPGDPASSAVLFRMSQRNLETQMPPFASELVDEAGLSVVERFTRQLGPTP